LRHAFDAILRETQADAEPEDSDESGNEEEETDR
jgi:hypothetical protein